jgi:hypothetical protein
MAPCELHRKPGIVLVEHDAAGIAPERGLAGDDVAELVHVLAPHHPLGDRTRQLDLAVGPDAVPVVDNDSARAREGGLVDLVAGTDDVRVGDGDDHLPGLQPFTAKHRHL